MQIGLVGAPNSGKSTFLKACTLKDVEIANYPFTTIDANRGIAHVSAECPCKELKLSCDPQNSECINGKRMVPVKLLDVAGLVPEAHKGKGLGNQFLNDLREADVLIHVLDISGKTNAKGEPVQDYDPYKNVEFLENELNEWFKDIFRREWKKIISEIGHNKIDLEEQLLSRFSGLKIEKEDINTTLLDLNLKDKNPKKWTETEIENFCIKLRKRTKPIIIAANKIDLLKNDAKLDDIKQRSDNLVIPCCAEAELALRNAAEKDIIEYTPGSNRFEINDIDSVNSEEKTGLEFIKKILEAYDSTGIQKCLNTAVFEVLDKIIVYPVEDDKKFTDGKNRVLPDAHIIDSGSSAMDLAYKIHSDIGDKFIGAIDCKTSRKIGADHRLKNNDIIKILTEK